MAFSPLPPDDDPILRRKKLLTELQGPAERAPTLSTGPVPSALPPSAPPISGGPLPPSAPPPMTNAVPNTRFPGLTVPSPPAAAPPAPPAGGSLTPPQPTDEGGNPPPVGEPSFTDFERDYWAADRREVLLDILRRDYHAPDRDQQIARFQNMSQAELFPHGTSHLTGGAGAGTGGNTPPPGPFNQQTWQQLTTQYPGTVAGLEALVRDHPELGLTIVGGSRGDIRLPDGTVVDVINSAGTGGQGWQWLLNPGGGGGGGGNTPAGGGPNTPYTPGSDPLQDAIRRRLLDMLNRDPSNISINDPHLAPQAEAYRNARNRGAGNERAAMAERAAASGLNSGGQGSGAFDSTLQGINEGAGEDIAGYEAGLVGQEVQAQRQQLMQAIGIADAIGARNEGNALRWQLAMLDDRYRYAALDENGRQFDEGMDLSWQQLEQILNRQAYLDAMG